MSSVNLISYNLKSHVAYAELLDLTVTHDAKIVCLQECYSDNLTDTIGQLKLAGKTTTGKFGLAVYCDNNRYQVVRSLSVPLSTSIHEKLFPRDRERLLIVELYDRTSKQRLFVASFHATHFVATNYLRRRQLSAALTVLNNLNAGCPVVLAGDFNYPYFHNKLKHAAQSLDYNLVTTDKPTFYGRKFSGRFDMAATSNMHTHHIRTLPFGLSDHAPILLNLSAVTRTSIDS